MREARCYICGYGATFDIVVRGHSERNGDLVDIALVPACREHFEPLWDALHDGRNDYMLRIYVQRALEAEVPSGTRDAAGGYARLGHVISEGPIDHPPSGDISSFSRARPKASAYRRSRGGRARRKAAGLSA